MLLNRHLDVWMSVFFVVNLPVYSIFSPLEFHRMRLVFLWTISADDTYVRGFLVLRNAPFINEE